MIDDHPLQQYTFQIRHNPNCPMPYQVITCGTAPSADWDDRRCLFSYGKTLEQAMDEALFKINLHRDLTAAIWCAKIEGDGEASKVARQLMEFVALAGYAIRRPDPNEASS